MGEGSIKWKTRNVAKFRGIKSREYIEKESGQDSLAVAGLVGPWPNDDEYPAGVNRALANRAFREKRKKEKRGKKKVATLELSSSRKTSLLHSNHLVELRPFERVKSNWLNSRSRVEEKLAALDTNASRIDSSISNPISKSWILFFSFFFCERKNVSRIFISSNDHFIVFKRKLKRSRWLNFWTVSRCKGFVTNFFEKSGHFCISSLTFHKIVYVTSLVHLDAHPIIYIYRFYKCEDFNIFYFQFWRRLPRFNQDYVCNNNSKREEAWKNGIFDFRFATIFFELINSIIYILFVVTDKCIFFDCKKEG